MCVVGSCTSGTERLCYYVGFWHPERWRDVLADAMSASCQRYTANARASHERCCRRHWLRPVRWPTLDCRRRHQRRGTTSRLSRRWQYTSLSHSFISFFLDWLFLNMVKVVISTTRVSSIAEGPHISSILHWRLRKMNLQLNDIKCVVMTHSRLKSTMTLKLVLGVIYYHWKWHYSVNCVWLKIYRQTVKIRWIWVTPDQDFKVAVFFKIKYFKNSPR